MLSLPRELPWRSCQAAFLPGRDAAQAVCCELSKEWGRPLFVAQLDLKKAFDKAKHSAISDALLSKGVSPHHVAILNSLWSQSSMLFKLGHLRAARAVKAHRGVPQGAPESPLVFTTLVDEILGPLISKWTEQGLGWALDQVLMTCLAYADDVLLFADSLEKLECMFNDCCISFDRAGLTVGAEKTHRSSTVVSLGVSMRAGEHDVLWERTLTFVGCELEPSGHSGAALAHRIVKANGVFSAWRPILLNPNIPLRARAAAFGISVVSSLLWQAGNWTLTESELSRLGSWGARKLFALSCKKRNPSHSIGEHWKQLHRVGHEMAARLSLDLREKALEVKHRFAGHFARLQPGSLLLLCSRFVTWRGGGSNRRILPSSRTSGMVSTHKGLIAGAGRLFLKSFSNKLPDLLTVIPGISAGNKLHRIVRLGWLPGPRLLLVLCEEFVEVRRCAFSVVLLLIFDRIWVHAVLVLLVFVRRRPLRRESAR